MAEKKENDLKLTRFMLWPAALTVQNKSIPLPSNLGEINPNGYKYVLGIFAPAKDFLKITSYYLNTPDVTKISFVFDKIDDDMVKLISNVIKEVKDPPIHVSGFCMKSGKYIYELYTRGKKQTANKIIQLVQKLPTKFESTVEEIAVQAKP
nr:hypothetical protein [Candidatus Sigynarchaeota archaeon]